MSELKAVTLAIVVVALASAAAFAAVVALGGEEGLPIVASILVLGIGADRISSLIMGYDRP